jgi:hypothetical protein
MRAPPTPPLRLALALALALAAALAPAAASGCGGSLFIPRSTALPAPRAIGALFVVTPGVVIEAVDGSFALRGGVPGAAPPFAATLPAGLTRDAVREDPALQGWAACVFDRFDDVCVRQTGGLERAHAGFVRAGARAVRVSAPNLAAPLYGVLYLGPTLDKEGVARGDRYEIAVPAEHAAAAAAGGEITAAYGQSVVPGVGYVRTWILWLSATPL